MHKELYKKMAELDKAAQNTRDKYVAYLNALLLQKEAAEKVSECAQKWIECPHIEVDDFEIDG